MDGRPIKEQIISGLRLAAKILLVFFTGALLVGGIAILRRSEHVLPDSLVGHHRFIPWVCVIAATVVLIPTVNRWITILPGILGYAALGSLIMLATGHYGAKTVPRLVALALTIFAVAGGALTQSFARRSLTLIDRIALLVFVFCLAFSMSADIPGMSLVLGIGFAFLLLAWLVDRNQNHREGEASPWSSSARRLFLRR